MQFKYGAHQNTQHRQEMYRFYACNIVSVPFITVKFTLAAIIVCDEQSGTP
jgi:hypothetical protein